MMLIFRLLFLSSVVSAGAVHGQEKPVSLGREGDALRPAISGEYAPYDWPDAPPENCPHAQSTDITGIQFTGRYANYTGADTWYPMWAADGNNYSAWTDGYVWTDHETTPYECKYCDRAWIYRAKSLGKEEIEKEWGAGVLKPYHCHSNVDPCCTGQAKIVGDSPLALEFIPLGRMHSGQSLYPCVSLVAGGVFYIGNYQAYDNGGRFNGFRYSRDWDHWTEELQPGWKNEFWIDARAPETDFWPEDQQPRRFNVPHAVALGQANRLSPDGKIYLTAHGAITGGSSNWDKGDAIYLCRVDPEPQAITDPKRYEFFGTASLAVRA
ncbi:MAG: hypothetical protein HYV26_07930 [Candidatus Hydrogenedentes bacterium]|nr:hypothetical protein [Candidatus Hydrogenedentota bacterium]